MHAPGMSEREHACMLCALHSPCRVPAGLRVAPAILHACATARFRGARWTRGVPVPTCQPLPSGRIEQKTLRPRRQILPATAHA